MNGGVYDEKVPANLARKMSVLWGEGSENLTNLIEYCILNDIRTFASCKGHSEYGEAYIGFTKMPKDFYKYIMDYMQEERNDRSIQYDLSRFGDHEPKFCVRVYSDVENREEMFKKLLEGTKEYTKHKDDLDLSGIDSTFDETVEYIFSKDGFGKLRIIRANGSAEPYKNMPEYYADKEGHITYAYSPIRRFCRSSKKALSSILNVPNRIKEQLREKEITNEDKERE